MFYISRRSARRVRNESEDLGPKTTKTARNDVESTKKVRCRCGRRAVAAVGGDAVLSGAGSCGLGIVKDRGRVVANAALRSKPGDHGLGVFLESRHRRRCCSEGLGQAGMCGHGGCGHGGALHGPNLCQHPGATMYGYFRFLREGANHQLVRIWVVRRL